MDDFSPKEPIRIGGSAEKFIACPALAQQMLRSGPAYAKH